MHDREYLERFLLYAEENAVRKTAQPPAPHVAAHDSGRLGIPREVFQRCCKTSQETGAELDTAGFVEVNGVKDVLKRRRKEDDPI